MRIPFTEPTLARHIYINPKTNQVHLLVPIVGGQEISTDNTCKTTKSLKDFFDGSALHELSAYKDALIFDISLLKKGNPQLRAKKERLAQIEIYITEISAMKNRYENEVYAGLVNHLLAHDSNLYSIKLRPRAQNSNAKITNNIFSVNRQNDERNGTPLSPLYNAMHSIFRDVVIAVPDPQSILTKATLADLSKSAKADLSKSPDFEDIKNILTAQCKLLFGIDIDLTCYFESIKVQRTKINPSGIETIKHTVDKKFIDDIQMSTDSTPEEYISALLKLCAPHISTSISGNISHFQNIPTTSNAAERSELLSILTQFFLASLNVYCRINGISNKNFGAVLDASPALSNELVHVIATALSTGDDVETVIWTFCNEHASESEFWLSRPISAEELITVKQRFAQMYRTVTITKEHIYMDNFLILDKEATDEKARFVTHQGSICINFADIINEKYEEEESVCVDFNEIITSQAHRDYYERIRADFAQHPAEIPQINEHIYGEEEASIELVLAGIHDDLFERLPEATKNACIAHPYFQIRNFLLHTARGQEEEAVALLTAVPANTQKFLQTPGIFTDYSGRTFNCTAYEYAYWAMDTGMCLAFQQLMDSHTKKILSKLISEMKRIDPVTGAPVGLVYQQHGITHRSLHFDMKPLQTALQSCIRGYNTYTNSEMSAAWFEVIIAQCDLPANIVQGYYCRPGTALSPKPELGNANLPRNVTFYNQHTGKHDLWFPLQENTVSALGLLRGNKTENPVGRSMPDLLDIEIDLTKLNRFENEKITNLEVLRKHLAEKTTSSCTLL